MRYVVTGNFQPSSDVTSYSLSNLSLGGLKPKIIILCTNAAANWRSSTEYIISGSYVNAGADSTLSDKISCSKFYSSYVRSYGASNGSSYLNFSTSANGVTITTSNSAKITSAKSYYYIICA